jgi:hypothetical protein
MAVGFWVLTLIAAGLYLCIVRDIVREVQGE